MPLHCHTPRLSQVATRCPCSRLQRRLLVPARIGARRSRQHHQVAVHRRVPRHTRGIAQAHCPWLLELGIDQHRELQRFAPLLSPGIHVSHSPIPLPHESVRFPPLLIALLCIRTCPPPPSSPRTLSKLGATLAAGRTDATSIADFVRNSSQTLRTVVLPDVGHLYNPLVDCLITSSSPVLTRLVIGPCSGLTPGDVLPVASLCLVHCRTFLKPSILCLSFCPLYTREAKTRCIFVLPSLLFALFLISPSAQMMQKSSQQPPSATCVPALIV